MTPSPIALARSAAVLLASAQALAQVQPTPTPAGAVDKQHPSELDDLRARVLELERRNGSAPQSTTPSGEVDLSGREVRSLAKPPDQNPLARPWYENLDVWGYASFLYLDTGSVGDHPDGGFLVQEASIFAEAHVWDRTVLHVELIGASVGYDFLSTGELYADLKQFYKRESGDFASLRLGRFWVPFGEETFWFRATENPLISYSAAFPWGLDEGVELYGSAHGVDWTVAVTSGNGNRNSEDGTAKTINLKLSGKPFSHLDLEGSLMKQGATSSSALAFGGESMDPVGSNGTSTAGVSPSSRIDATLAEVDAKILVCPRTSLGLTAGHAAIDDAVNAFDRSFRWVRVEPRYDITPTVYADVRYSEIGTYDSTEGYHFDGLMIANGNTFGYDVRKFRRVSGGLGWKVNPHTLLKLEVGRDRFWAIDGSPTSPGAGDRTFFGFDLTVSF